ncbi:DUF3231 family protein [Paenibacillus aurantiacus]|uniref:DUF3231 family protein n=1 Tax=Paenibacillus aurantiacus TaxID=1936118 RepID=A0ABV5L020_9BACL
MLFFNGHHREHQSLTSAEVSALWFQYMGDTMSICVYNYFVKIAEDNEIKPILNTLLQLAEGHVKKIKGFLDEANFLVPDGFSEGDVNLQAPRLFSDRFLLFYSYIMTLHGISAYSLALSSCERPDIQDYFFDCIVSTKEIYQRISLLGRSWPKFSSIPNVPSPHTNEYLHATGILTNLFGDKRPLNASEITNLFFNSKKTAFVRTLSIAFSQVAQEEEVREFLRKNGKLAGQDADSFDAFLRDDHLSIPQRWDDEITDSIISPFSDRLIMFHASFLVNAALTYYGAAIGTTLRSDVALNYKSVSNHAMEAGGMCFNIMVKKGWLEKQPESIDRDALAGK